MDLSKADPAFRLFERWLAEPPNPKLLTTWKTDYVDALSLVLSREAKHELRIEILNRVQALVAMTGPFSGIGQMLSRAVQAIIDEVDCALS